MDFTEIVAKLDEAETLMEKVAGGMKGRPSTNQMETLKAAYKAVQDARYHLIMNTD